MTIYQSIQQKKDKCPKCGGILMITKTLLKGAKRYATCKQCKEKYILIDY